MFLVGFSRWCASFKCYRWILLRRERQLPFYISLCEAALGAINRSRVNVPEQSQCFRVVMRS